MKRGEIRFKNVGISNKKIMVPINVFILLKKKYEMLATIKMWYIVNKIILTLIKQY